MALKIGDRVPHFVAIDGDGNAFDSQLFVGHKPLVIYFYPKDHTPGCTAQACSFRDQYQDFEDLGAEIIGVSGDSAAAHRGFSAQYKLPFTLLSDFDKKLRSLFGVPTQFFGMMPGRVTYIIDKEGFVFDVFDHFLATKHIKTALERLKKMS